MSSPRLRGIIEYVEKHNFASVDELSKALGFSTQTIRRDVRTLANQGLIDRYHGGAAKLTSGKITPNKNYDERKTQRRSGKEKIGALIAERIKDGSSVFLTIGTTMESVAHALKSKRDLTIFTNSLKVANILHEETDFDIIIPSGRVKKRNGGLSDYDTKEFIEKIRVDYLLFSGSALDKNGYVLDYFMSEVSVTLAVLERCSKAFLALDTTKINATAPIEVLSIKDVDAMFLDEDFDAENIKEIAKEGSVEIITP